MFSISCIKLIELDFKHREGVTINDINLGGLSIEFDTDVISRETIAKALQELGFETVVDPDLEIVEKTKIAAKKKNTTAEKQKKQMHPKYNARRQTKQNSTCT